MFDVNNKVAVITGAANGIGAKVVEILLEQGAKHVAILDIAKNGEDFEKELTGTFGAGRVKFYKCDATDENAVDVVFENIKKEFKNIDILVNNAGIMSDNYQSYKTEMQLNFTAVVVITLKAFEWMRVDKGGNGGVIMNIASIAALMQNRLLPIYSATKSAVLQFSNCLGDDSYYSRTNVRVVCICFGATGTALLAPGSVGNFDVQANSEVDAEIEKYYLQKVESAASGLVEALKQGANGSTWLATNDKPARDITDKVSQAYGILTATFING